MLKQWHRESIKKAVDRFVLFQLCRFWWYPVRFIIVKIFITIQKDFSWLNIMQI